jgi:hypothetical protein
MDIHISFARQDAKAAKIFLGGDRSETVWGRVDERAFPETKPKNLGVLGGSAAFFSQPTRRECLLVG